MSSTTSAQATCEHALSEIKRTNEADSIWPSANAVADRLLSRGVELKDAYQEIYDKLNMHPPALPVFLEQILITTALWNPEKVRKSRDQRDALTSTNHLIAKKASELAELLRERESLHNTSGFSSDTHYDVLGLLDEAAAQNGLYRSHVREPLLSLQRRYDAKYWPSLNALVAALAADARDACIEATDPLTAASTNATRASKVDFLRALMVSIDENRSEYGGFIPQGFSLTDRTLASLVNCALDLGPDDVVDEGYVKRFRQREREKES